MESIEHQVAATSTAPRVTPEDIAAVISSEHYFTGENGVRGAALFEGGDGYTGTAVPLSLNILTFCVLTLRNGFTVTGESACASPENFDAEIGRRIARENAVNKIWPLMGFALKESLHQRAFQGNPS